MMVREGAKRRYQLLGDVRAFDGDLALSLGASKPRSLLAILLLRAGSVVPTEVACDLLWSGEPPRSAATTLHGYISGLRAATCGRAASAGRCCRSGSPARWGGPTGPATTWPASAPPEAPAPGRSS